MANRAKDAREAAQVRWPGALVFARNRNTIVHQHPTNPDKFMVDARIGPMHFGTGEDQEIDTAWVEDTISRPPWRYKMVLADYNAWAFRESTLQFNQGQLIEYVHPESSEGITFQPMQLQWSNDLEQISPIGDAQAVSATVLDDRLTWIGAYGAGLDFRWEVQAARMFKALDVNSLAELGSPPQFIIDGGNPYLRLELLFQKSANVELLVDGVVWDEKANNPQTTANDVEFRLKSTSEPLWYFRKPRAWGSEIGGLVGQDFFLEMHIRQSANNLFVQVRVPWSWLETAVFPLVIDATVEVNPSVGADDGRWAIDNLSLFLNNEGTANLGYVSSDYPDASGFFRFSGITMSGTIDSNTYLSVYSDPVIGTNFNIFADDNSNNPSAPANAAEANGATRTTASVAFDFPDEGWGWQQSSSIATVIQELVDSYSYSSNVVMLYMDDDSPTAVSSVLMYEYDSYDPILHIEYTVPTAQFGRPDSDVSTGNWTTTPLNEKIDEETPSDVDYIQSEDTPASDTCEVGLSDVTDPVASDNHHVRVRYQAPESGGGGPASIDFTIKLMENGTERGSWLEQPNPPSTWLTVTKTLTTGEADAINNYANLRLRFIANQTGGARVSRIEISWAELEVPLATAEKWLAGESNGVAIVTGHTILDLALEAISSGSSVVSSPMFKVDRALAGQSDGVATVTAPYIRKDIPFAGQSNGIAVVTAPYIRRDVPFAGQADGLSTVTARILLSLALRGQADGVAAVSAPMLRVDRWIAGISNGLATPTGHILLNLVVAGQSNGLATVTAALGIEGSGEDVMLAGISSGLTIVTGHILMLMALAGQSDGSSDVIEPMLKVDRWIAGQANGVAIVTAPMLRISRALAGQSDGVAPVTAAMLRDVGLQATSNGIAAVTADISRDIGLRGISIGNTNVTAHILLLLKLAGLSQGLSSVSGQIRLVGEVERRFSIRKLFETFRLLGAK